MTPTFDDNHLLGVDIYHLDYPLSFHDLASAGAAFIFIKSSQGLSGTDPHFADNYARAQSVGLLTSAYHFFLPDCNPVRQARHFLNAAPLGSGDLRHCLDVETDGPNVGAEALACAEEIKVQTGRYPIIYASDSFFQDRLKASFPVGDYTLWIADYSRQPATPCAFWQFTDGKRYPNNSALDSSVFYGTLDDLSKECY